MDEATPEGPWPYLAIADEPDEDDAFTVLLWMSPSEMVPGLGSVSTWRGLLNAMEIVREQLAVGSVNVVAKPDTLRRLWAGADPDPSGE